MDTIAAEQVLPATTKSADEVPELACQDLAKSFAHVSVLENVSFDFFKGTVNILAGENGAGKSTILKIVSGQYHPDRGIVRVAGKPVTHLTHDMPAGWASASSRRSWLRSWTCPSTRTCSSVGSCIRGPVFSTTTR